MNTEGLFLEVQVPVTYTFGCSLKVAVEAYKEHYGEDPISEDDFIDFLMGNMSWEDFEYPDLIDEGEPNPSDEWYNSPKRIGRATDSGIEIISKDYDFEDYD